MNPLHLKSIIYKISNECTVCRHYVWGWNNKIQSLVVDDCLAEGVFFKAVHAQYRWVQNSLVSKRFSLHVHEATELKKLG